MTSIASKLQLILVFDGISSPVATAGRRRRAVADLDFRHVMQWINSRRPPGRTDPHLLADAFGALLFATALLLLDHPTRALQLLQCNMDLFAHREKKYSTFTTSLVVQLIGSTFFIPPPCLCKHKCKNVHVFYSPDRFYRAMHYSAKRGLAIASSVRPSVCPSVTLADHDHIG